MHSLVNFIFNNLGVCPPKKYQSPLMADAFFTWANVDDSSAQKGLAGKLKRRIEEIAQTEVIDSL